MDSNIMGAFSSGGGGGGAGAYTELANETLGSSNNKIESGTLSTTGMRFLHISFHGLYVSGQSPTAPYMTFNDSAVGEYQYLTAIDDGNDVAAADSAFIAMGSNNSTSDCFCNGYVTNLDGQLSEWIFNTLLPKGAGTDVPQRSLSRGYWDNTAEITSIEFRNEASRLWDTDSQIIVTGIK